VDVGIVTLLLQRGWQQLRGSALATHLDAGKSLEPPNAKRRGNPSSCSTWRSTGDSFGGLDDQQLTRVKLARALSGPTHAKVWVYPSRDRPKVHATPTRNGDHQ
jgi:hypothetical protein